MHFVEIQLKKWHTNVGHMHSKNISLKFNDWWIKINDNQWAAQLKCLISNVVKK